MENTNDILNELASWGSPLVGMSRVMPYIIPEQYFEGLTETLQYVVSENPESLPNAIPDLWLGLEKSRMPYTVPQGYFEQFPQQALAEISADEVIAGLPTFVPFALPQGYFETFPAQVLDRVKTAAESSDTGRIIPLKRRNRIWRQARWAAAAILLAGIGLGSYKTFVKHPLDTEKALAALPQGEINDYVQQNIDDFDVDMIVNNMSENEVSVQLKQIDNKEIREYLNNNGWQDSE